MTKNEELYNCIICKDKGYWIKDIKMSNGMNIPFMITCTCDFDRENLI